MKVRQRLGAAVAVAVGCATIGFGGVAEAGWEKVHSDPWVNACYEYVNAYGGLYKIKHGIVNNTSDTQVVETSVWRNGLYEQGSGHTVASPNAWVFGNDVYVSIALNDKLEIGGFNTRTGADWDNGRVSAVSVPVLYTRC